MYLQQTGGEADDTLTGALAKKYNIPYELIRRLIGESELETEKYVFMFEDVIREAIVKWRHPPKKIIMNIKGKRLLNSPFGYCRDENGKIQKDPDEYEIVERILAWHEHGLTYREIIEELRDNGMKTYMGNDIWSEYVVGCIIRRERKEENK